MNQEQVIRKNSLRPIYKVIEDGLEDVERKYEELIVQCENTYAQIFKRFDVIEIAFAQNIPYMFTPYEKRQIEESSLRYFDFEVQGKKLQLYTPKYGFNHTFYDFDYVTKLPLLIDSVNEYLSAGLPTSEWPKGIRSPFYIKDNKEAQAKHVNLELDITEADFMELCYKKQDLYDKAVCAIKDLMKSNGYRRILVPKGKVLPAIKEFEFRMDLIEIDYNHGEMLLIFQENNRIHPISETNVDNERYLYPKVLKSVYESIEYYRQHPDEIPENCLI